MTEHTLKIVAGFIPYSDGSGFQVTVTIEQEQREGAALTMGIEATYRFEAVHWPEIRDGIDQLMSVVPRSARTAI